MVCNLNIHSWNANGVGNKLAELTAYIREQNVDIMFINEIKLQYTTPIKIPGYEVHLKSRPGSRFGGVGVLIKQGVPYGLGKSIDITIEHININVAKNLTIIGVYNKPTNNFTINCLNKLFKQNKQVLVIGDLNATHTYWNCNRINQNGRTLYTFLNINDERFLHHTNDHTHYPTNGMTPTTIDLAITQNVQGLTNLETHPKLSSDHNPIFLQIHYTGKQNVDHTTTSYKYTNWSQYRKIINEKITITPNLTTIPELEQALKITTTTLQTVKNKVTKQIKTKHEDPLPKEILEIITIRNRFRKIWQRTGRREYLDRTRNLTQDIKHKIKTHKNEVWSKKLQDLSPVDNSIWKLSKALKNKNKSLPALTKDGRNYITDEEKANLLADTFEQIHHLPDDNTIEQRNITNHYNTLIGNTITVDRHTRTKIIATPTEIKNIVRYLPNNKAPGKDDIDYKLLKNLPTKGLVQMTYIINAIMLLQHWPAQWKTAVVIPIAKPGKNPNNHDSYRPISLLSTLSKVTEKLILTRINTITQELQLPDKVQFGFKHGHNTTQQVTRLVTDIIQNFKKNKTTAMVLLDIEKAFDRVWIAGLVEKLSMLGYPPYIVQLIHSYLSERKMTVKIKNTYSRYRTITAGVPQGSVLGPVLFNIYISDIPTFHNSNLALFADDTALYAHSFYAQAAAALTQCHLDRIIKYYRKWKIKLNVNKSEVIIFSRKYTNSKLIRQLRVDNTLLPQKDNVKYLGVTLDKRLRFGQHLQTVLHKAYQATRCLYPLLNKNSTLSEHNKKLLYTVMLRPIIAYAAPVWMGVSTTALRPLQSYQNKMLRLVTNKGRYERITTLHELTEIPQLREYIQQQAQNFYKKLDYHENPLVRNITNIRHDNDLTTKHPLPYKTLELYETRRPK